MNKICFILNGIGAGGAERVAVNLSEEFCRMGYLISFIVISEYQSNSFFTVNENISIKYLVDKNKKPPFFLKRVRLLHRLIENESPDVLISFLPHVDIYTYFANRRLKIRHFVSERSNPYLDPKNIILRKLKEYVFKRANGCVFQTLDAMNYYKKTIQKKSIVIPNPINKKLFNNILIERKNNVVAVGRLVPQKNYHMLIKAFKLFVEEYPDYILKIYGDGILKNELRNLTYKLKIEKNVHFCGKVSNISDKIKDAKLYVLSSISEGMPNSLIEAMALGLPCISTNCPIGGPKELIQNYENGILIKTNDYLGLYKAMKELTDNPTLSIKISENAKKIVDFLDVEIIAKKWIEFIFK